MRVGIIQSNYIPWRGYFDFIDDVDLFIFHDDLQYTKGDWRNRNRIRTPAGTRWISVPVKYAKTSQLICETRIDYSTKWPSDHVNIFYENYRKAPFVSDAIELLRKGLAYRDETISALNIRLIRLICEYLGINTALKMSSDYGVSGVKTVRLINLLNKAGGTCYLSGPAGKSYIVEEIFRENQITLEYKSYDYLPYPQVMGDFDGAVSVLDLIANVGPEARRIFKSQSPNIVARSDG